jgi:ubiquinone/menaquinone biosynthesis C-methylase UbiE
MTEIADSSFSSVAAYYEYLMSGVPYRFWVRHIEQYWTSVGSDPKHILDLATGTGTVARLLAQRGKTVVGVDLSAAMLEIAEKRAVEDGVSIDWRRQDMSELDLPGQTFDAAICLFDSINYVLEEDRFKDTLVRVGSHLRSGGTFVFDMNAELAFILGMFNQSCSRKDEPLHYRWRQRYNEDTKLCTVRMRFVYRPIDGSGEQIFHEVHRQRAYPMDDVLSWLAEAGFHSITVTDSYSDCEATPDSDRLVFHAVKL